jgi:hypothetical protein
LYLVEGGDEDEAEDKPQGDAGKNGDGLNELANGRHFLEVVPPILYCHAKWSVES